MASRDPKTREQIAEASRKAGEAAQVHDLNSKKARQAEALLIDRRLTYLTRVVEEEQHTSVRLKNLRYKG